MGKNKDKGLSGASDELDDFESATSGGEYWKPVDFDGALHLIKPYRLDPNAFSGGSNPEAVIGDIVVLDEDDPTEPQATFSQAKIGGKAVINQLSGPMARQTRLVVRLRKVHPEGKGKNDYWAFDPATDRDKAVARSFLAAGNPL